MTPSKPWTFQDLALLGGSQSAAELAPLMGRTIDSIYGKRNRMKMNLPVADVPKKVPAITAYETDKSDASDISWEKKFKELDRKYRRALHEGTVVDHLVAEISDLAPVSYSPLPAVHDVRPLGEHTSQSALLMLSDTHVGLKVVPEQTLGFGNYNFPIFLARLKYLEESVISILRGHTTMKIDELVIPMLDRKSTRLNS